jgi:putative transposase
MKRPRYSDEQIIRIHAEHEAGAKCADLCRKHGVSEGTFYDWKAKFGGMTVSEAKRLKSLEVENAKLKKLLPMRVHERHHHFDRRSSSAIAKYALSLQRISFAWRSSRFSRSSAFNFSAISVGIPARRPLSTSAFLIHSFSVCGARHLRRNRYDRLPTRFMLAIQT